MELNDLIVYRSLPYKKYLDELERLCKEHNLILTFVKMGRRVYLSIEGKSSAIGLFFTTPKPEREVNNIAWNRISKIDSVNLKEYHGITKNDKSIQCLVLQIWENYDSVVVIPLDELNKIPEFRKKGDFHIKKDGSYFVLMTPKWDDNIRLKEGIDKVLDYL